VKRPDAALAPLRDAACAPGRLHWVGLRPARRAPVAVVASAEAHPGSGLAGDHHARPNSRRTVTLFQWEHLAVVGALLGRPPVDPALLRRNLGVSGLNVAALVDRRFTIGGVLFEGSGWCEPCARLEEALGPGGYAASFGHGGITARVLSGGWLSVGDAVTPLPPDAPAPSPSA
jgi:MOSC domain-containing protein YiiM